MELGAALADDDAPARHGFTGVALHTEILGIAVPPIPARALSLFMRHD
jgi:hypothetical protein